MVDANHRPAGVTLSLAASLPPGLIKDGPLYRAIRTAPETHTTVPATLRMPYFVEKLIASTLKKTSFRFLFSQSNTHLDSVNALMELGALPCDHRQEKREHRHGGLERRGVGSVGVAEADEIEERVHEEPAAEIMVGEISLRRRRPTECL